MNVFIINSADTYEHRVDLLYSYFKKQGNHVTVLASDFRHIAKERRMEPKEGYKFFSDKISYESYLKKNYEACNELKLRFQKV